MQVSRPAPTFLPNALMAVATLPPTDALAVGGKLGIMEVQPVAQLHLVKAAAETVGFFQVVNHDVPAALLAASVRLFHESVSEAKTPYCTRPRPRLCAASTSCSRRPRRRTYMRDLAETSYYWRRTV